MESNMVNELSMRPLDVDPALFYKKKENGIEVVSGSYIDGGLYASNKQFDTMTENTIARFKSNYCLYDSFDFFSTQNETFNNCFLYVGKLYYAKNLTIVPLDTSYEQFRSLRASFA